MRPACGGDPIGPSSTPGDVGDIQYMKIISVPNRYFNKSLDPQMQRKSDKDM